VRKPDKRLLEEPLMMNKALATTAVLASLVSGVSFAADSIARFEGGIGSQPLRSGAAPNVVNGVNPGGIPWVISSLSVDVKGDGRISVAGRGLLLAGGNGVATTGGQSVKARLFCGGVPQADTSVVPLDEDGDFRIEGTLLPAPPNPCSPATVLILSAGGNWFAAGIPKR
jgi:hypothetical protein